MSEYALEMLNISKSFPGVKALDNVTFRLRPGSVHALMGENGAGKSTLMKCLFGVYKPDGGEILLSGERVTISSPLDALHKGIAMVHQELQPIPERSVAENIFCGRYPMKKLGPVPTIVDHKEMNRLTAELLSEVRLNNIEPTQKLGTLSVSQMQSVEIAKAMSADAKIIILDEPTSSLTENEVEALFTIIERLKNQGRSIIYISHKMDEILRISDEVTILRDGQLVGSWASGSLTRDDIITRMVGRELVNLYPPRHNVPGEAVFEVKNFSSILPGSFRDVSFSLRRGEILGVGGLVGAQRTELMEAIFGMRRTVSGEVIYRGETLRVNRPRDAIKKGIALLTEDRRSTGIFSVLPVSDNVSIASLDKYLSLGFVLSDGRIREVVRDSVEKLSIKTPGLKTLIQSLSGGNQQKVIISRWLANDPDVLILDEPTRGIDVGAKYEIYTIIAELAAQGKSIIMISSEMPELIGMSDRVMVMCAGRLTGIVEGADINQEKIMELATQFEYSEVCG